MPTVQALLDTVDATYRNSYSVALKVQWMDTVQRQIFQRVPKEAEPYTFQTTAGNALYVLPADCDRQGIKQVTIESKAGSDKYGTLPYLSIESNTQVSERTPLYSVLEQNLFINPMPTDEDEGKAVFLFYNKRPAALSSSSLGATPNLEEDFHELLILGCLERIARARGEIDDKNNFAADYNALLADYERQYKLRQPEYYKPKDNLPMRRGRWTGVKGRHSTDTFKTDVASLLPPGLS